MEAAAREVCDVLRHQKPGNYADKGSKGVIFQANTTVLAWILNESKLKYSYKASVSCEGKIKKVHATISWTFEDRIDANSFFEQSDKGGFDPGIPINTLIVNAAEALADLGFDKLAGAGYDLILTWTTEVDCCK